MLTNKRKKYLRRKWGGAHLNYNEAYQGDKYLTLMQKKKDKQQIARLEKNLSDLGYYVDVSITSDYYYCNLDMSDSNFPGEFVTLKSGYLIEDHATLERWKSFYDFTYNLDSDKRQGYTLISESCHLRKQYAKICKDAYFLVSHSHWYSSSNSERVYWFGDYNELLECTDENLPRHARYMSAIQTAVNQHELSEEENSHCAVCLHFYNDDGNLVDSLFDCIFHNDGQDTEQYFIDEAKYTLIPEFITGL